MNPYLKEFLTRMVKIHRIELIGSSLFFGIIIILFFLKNEWALNALYIEIPLFVIFLNSRFDKRKFVSQYNLSYRSEELFTMPLNSKELYFAVMTKSLLSIYSYYLFIACFALCYSFPKNVQGMFDFLSWGIFLLFIILDGQSIAQLRTYFKINNFNHRIVDFIRKFSLIFAFIIISLLGLYIKDVTHFENSVFVLLVIFIAMINVYNFKNIDKRIFNEHDLFNKKGLKWHDIPVAIAMFSVVCLLIYVDAKQFKRNPSSINPKHTTK
jgi:hypothetical protein